MWAGLRSGPIPVTTLSYTENRPIYQIETVYKSFADQAKAFDEMRKTMLGALSFLGRTDLVSK